MEDTAIITIEKAENVSSNLADLLCWWQGFKTGIALYKDQLTDVELAMAENGIKELREINIKIKNAIGKK